MNATAAQLGATSSHYVDASGYEPGSVSTAADCLRIAAADMAIPTFAQIVNMTSVDLPLVGTVPNIVSEIGTDGIIGVKSGYTSQAKAGLVLAADRAVGGRTVLVLAAVLTQPVPAAIVPPTATTTTTAASAHAPPTSTTTTSTIPADDLEVPDVFRYAGPTAQSLLAAAQAGVVQVPVATAGQSAGTVTARWGGHSYPAEVIAARSAWLAGLPPAALLRSDWMEVLAGKNLEAVLAKLREPVDVIDAQAVVIDRHGDRAQAVDLKHLQRARI